jgi:3-hydroxyacyl-[acyl-carrier-protein] dehydratase
MWIDRVIELTPRQRLVAIKNVSLAEDHLHEHFPASPTDRSLPVMPASLIVEGMAQTAGILVGHTGSFREKVILAKVSRCELHREVVPGFTIRHTAQMRQFDQAGASTEGLVELLDPARPDAGAVLVGHIDLMFSHIDRNMSGTEFPEHNFVFNESFASILRNSGFARGPEYTPE